jgi:hypothetical protein
MKCMIVVVSSDDFASQKCMKSRNLTSETSSQTDDRHNESGKDQRKCVRVMKCSVVVSMKALSQAESLSWCHRFGPEWQIVILIMSESVRQLDWINGGFVLYAIEVHIRTHCVQSPECHSGNSKQHHHIRPSQILSQQQSQVGVNCHHQATTLTLM